MKNFYFLKLYSYLPILLLLLSFFITAGFSLAAPEESATTRTGGLGSNSQQSGGVPANPQATGGVGQNTFQGTTQLQNPLDSSISSIPAFFKTILDILLVFAIPFVVFFIILAGFKYVTARGNTSKIEEAHKALLYAVIGGLLILGAQAILVLITGTVQQFAPVP